RRHRGRLRRLFQEALKRDAAIVDLLRNVDLAILDAQYTRSEYRQRIGWGHTCLDDAVALALESGAAQLVLFHHDPDHDDDHIDAMVAEARRKAAARDSTLGVEAAREGLEIVLHRKPADGSQTVADASRDDSAIHPASH